MKLFEPINIRGLTLKNRIVMAPMGIHFGLLDSRTIPYYVERARGGVGPSSSGPSPPAILYWMTWVNGPIQEGRGNLSRACEF